MNVIFKGLELLDDELLEMTVKSFRRGRRRMRAQKAVKIAFAAVAAAAACIALPFGVSSFGKWVKTAPPAPARANESTYESLPAEELDEEEYDSEVSGDFIETTFYAVSPQEAAETDEALMIAEEADYGSETEYYPAVMITDFKTADNVLLNWESEIPFEMEEFPEYGFKYTAGGVIMGMNGGYKAKMIFHGDPAVMSVYLADIDGDGRREICSVTQISCAKERIVAYSAAEDKSRELLCYSHIELELSDGELYYTAASTGRREKLTASMLTEYTESYNPTILAAQVIPTLQSEVRIYPDHSSELLQTKYININGRCYVDYDKMVLSKLTDPDEKMLEELTKYVIGLSDGLSYKQLDTMPSIGTGRVSRDAALNDFREETVGAGEASEICKINDDWVMVRVPVQPDMPLKTADVPEPQYSYDVYVYDGEHTAFAAAVRTIYSGWQSWDLQYVQNISLIYDHFGNNGHVCRISVTLSDSDMEQDFFDFLSRSKIDIGLVELHFQDWEAGTRASAEISSFLSTEKGEALQLAANDAALAYINGDEDKLQRLCKDAYTGSEYRNIPLGQIDRIELNCPFGFSIPADDSGVYTVTYRIVGYNGESYLSVRLESDGNALRVTGVEEVG